MNKLQKIIVKLFKIPTFTAAPAKIIFDFKPITLGASFVLNPTEQTFIIDGLIGEDAIRERLLKSMEKGLMHYLELECEKDYPFPGGATYRGKLRVLIPESRNYENERKEKIDDQNRSNSK